MFELVSKPEDIEKHPWKIFVLSFLVSIMAFVLSLRMFKGHSSILMVTFIIIPLVPIFVRIIEIEEGVFSKMKKNIFLRHSALKVFAYMFLGVILGLSAMYVISPESTRNDMFAEQMNALWGYTSAAIIGSDPFIPGLCDETILSALLLKYDITDCKLSDFNDDSKPEYLIFTSYSKRPSIIYFPESSQVKPYYHYLGTYILKNNLILLVFVFLTSFIFGTGAIFILVWNASVISVFVGEVILSLSYLHPVTAFLVGFPAGLLSIALHAIPEFLAFFISAVAGGILAVAFIRYKISNPAFKRVLLDSVVFFGTSIILLIVASFLEMI